jgi:hypothetical protein
MFVSVHFTVDNSVSLWKTSDGGESLRVMFLFHFDWTGLTNFRLSWLGFVQQPNQVPDAPKRVE